MILGRLPPILAQPSSPLYPPIKVPHKILFNVSFSPRPSSPSRGLRHLEGLSLPACLPLRFERFAITSNFTQQFKALDWKNRNYLFDFNWNIWIWSLCEYSVCLEVSSTKLDLWQSPRSALCKMSTNIFGGNQCVSSFRNVHFDVCINISIRPLCVLLDGRW